MSLLAAIAARRPHETALQDGVGTHTWSDVDRTVARAATLLQRGDIGPARRVAVFAPNATETALAHLAGALAGVSVVPISFHLGVEETAHILADSGAGVVFVGPSTAEIGREAASRSGGARVIGWRGASDRGAESWQDWLTTADGAAPSPEVPPRANLMYTSGTTGVPKGTELPPASLLGARTVAELQKKWSEQSWAEHGRHLVVGPLHHTGPQIGVRLLGGGVPVFVLPRFDAERTLATIESFAPGSTLMVPTHFIRLLALPEATRKRYDLSSLRLVYHTGAACPVDVKRAMLAWWGPVLYEAYGATEVGTTCRIGPEEWLAHPGSVGRAVPPFEALVVDDDGRPLPAGDTGRLYFRDATGRGIVYHNDPAKSAQAHIAPGVFTLGEIGHVDEDGFVYITDRFSDMIVSGGVNIYPAEAEQVLVDHPAVQDVACIGVPHPEMGEELVALVQAADPDIPLPVDELIALCRERLAHYKCPRRIVSWSDLGRNAMGKVNKKSLRAGWTAGTGAKGDPNP